MVSTAFLAPAALASRAAAPLVPSAYRCNFFAPPVRCAPSRCPPPNHAFIHASQSDRSPLPPSDASQPPPDASQPPPDASQPPSDTSQPPSDASQPPSDASLPPIAPLPEQPPLLSQLEQVSVFYVNPNSGKKVPCWKFWPPITPIRTGVLELPRGDVAHLQISTSRFAQANVFGKKEVLEGDLRNTPIIVFAHGFSQRPLNYFSLLAYFALQGYVVIAPRTWILSVLFADVETIDRKSSLPAKLQTALLIDTARAAQVASSYSTCVHVFGHSMGGAMSLVYSGYASSTLKSLALMAPEVGGCALTELNQTVRLDADDGVERMEGLAKEMACRMMVMHGDRDRIVGKDDMQTILSTFRSAPLTGLMSMKRGTHVGYEDSLEIDLPFIDLEEFVFAFIDFLIFGSFFDIFGLDTKEQLKSTKAVLNEWIQNVGRDEKDVKDAVEGTEIPSESTYSWN